MKTRIDPFTTIHKGIRRLLFERAMELGATDFEEDGELRAAVEGTWFALSLLQEHAEHEDQVTFLAVTTKDALLGLEAASQHAALDGLMHEISLMLDELPQAVVGERSALGRRLRASWNALVVEQLQHMAFEEEQLNPILWRAYTDAELATLLARIQARIPAERMATWRALLLPSIDRPERARLEAARQRKDAA